MTHSTRTSRTDVLDYGVVGDGVADDTDALQAAIDDTRTGGTVSLPLGTFALSRPLRITRSMRLLGEGVFPRWGRIATDWNSINAPIAAPWVDGTVLLQRAAATDILQLSGSGTTQHIDGIGLVFDAPHAFADTGHGILAEPDRLDGGYDNGIAGCLWSNIVVVGHDGDHYAASVVNGIYNDVRGFQSFGGGVLRLINDSTVDGHYGNSVFASLYGQVFAGGSADGIRLESRASPLNMLAFVRPQVTVNDMSETYPGVRPATSAQQMLRAVGEVAHVSMLQYDFETGIDSGLTPGDAHWWMDPAGILYRGDHRSHPAVAVDGGA